MYDGLVDKICTDKQVSWQSTDSHLLIPLKHTLNQSYRLALSAISMILFGAIECNYNSKPEILIL